MPRLTKSLTPDETSRLLDLSPELIEALLASGRVLCHVRGGETRIPLDQLESFFRDGLLNVYRAEHVVEEEKMPAAEAAAAPPQVVETAGVEREVAAPVLPAVAVMAEAEEPESPELRRAPRYIPTRQIDGYINDLKFTIVQISSSGLRIRHRGGLLPGEEAKVTVVLLRPAQSIVIRARVVWTSIAKTEGDSFSISGLRVIEHADRLARAVELLREAHELQPERRVRERRTSSPLFLLDSVSDEEITLVAGAIQKFASDPVEASRWYSRARFALSDENVRRDAPPRPRDREEILGLWEYLDRQIDIPRLTGIVNWMRKSKTAVG